MKRARVANFPRSINLRRSVLPGTVCVFTRARFELYRFASLLLFFAVAYPAAPALDRPNIVFIISDDHDYEHLGFMGNAFVQTPALDRLARAGTFFTTAHLPMSRCHPTLASFLSGRWPHQTGIYYNYGEKPLEPRQSLPSLLREAGYATYVEGKYWEGDPRAMGFTHGKGKTSRTFVRQGQQDLFHFIDEMAGQKPMFIWWAPLLPHTPHNPPEQYRNLYDWTQMPVPSYVKARNGENDSWRNKEQLSYAMEAWLDDGVAQLVEKLESRRQMEKTLFVFVIDNGWCNGLPSKGTPFEKGVRTPIFFSLPGVVKAGQRFDQLVSTHDLYPTILDYAGVPVPASAAGRSLRPLMEGKSFQETEALFGAIYPAFATEGDNRPERDLYALYVRTQKWKYILFLQEVRPERNQNYFRIQSIATEFPTRDRGDQDLYDLESDPYELHNLSNEPAHEKRLQEFKARALRWWRETGGADLGSVDKAG